jgi:hypothetical protein
MEFKPRFIWRRIWESTLTVHTASIIDLLGALV